MRGREEGTTQAGADHSTPQDEKKLSELVGGKPEDYFATAKGRNHLKQLFEEGSLHGALAISALQKLPPMAGTCYRGERMSLSDFRKKYGDSRNRKLPKESRRSLTSVATEKQAAEKFANKTDDPAKTVSVMSVVEIKTGRDVGDLSILGRTEKVRCSHQQKSAGSGGHSTHRGAGRAAPRALRHPTLR